MNPRRRFIKQSIVISAALMAGHNTFAAPDRQKIGLQMYTLRHVINSKNAPEVFAKVASIGYKELEIFGYAAREKFWGLEPGDFAALLRSNKLTAPAAHISFANFLQGKDENEFRVTCDAATRVGNKFLVVAWLDAQFRTTSSDYRLLSERLNKAAIIARQFGLQLAYHNHDFEFKLLDASTSGYDIILKNTDPDLVKMELDLYWAVKAGKDPVELFG